MKKPLLSFLSLLFIVKISIAQTTDLRKVIPPSPTVASLGKYGEIPVSLYTGVPNIQIPLYEIKNGDLKLPISLSYHAGGIKVEEMATCAGLGWSLGAGGIISRAVRGLPDEFGWYPKVANSTIESYKARNNSAEIKQLVDLVDINNVDGEADMYYYNCGSISGKFFFDESGNSYTIPFKKMLINNNNGWKITDEDGTVYSFLKEEYVDTWACSTYDEINTTGWFLTNIKSSDGKREINFTYEPLYYDYETLMGQTKYLPLTYDINSSGCLPSGSSPCIGTQKYSTHRLTRIDFQEGYVSFSYNKDRCDLIGDKSLDKIEVFTKDNVSIRTFNLEYAYFGNNSDGCNRPTSKNKRLKLLSVNEENGGIKKNPYQFKYNETIAIPDRLSFGQDHWGYYNGVMNNPGMVPTMIYTDDTGIQRVVPGADRKVNPTTSQMAILTNIIYPTGGETVFSYENNTTNAGDSWNEGPIIEKSMLMGASNAPLINDAVSYDEIDIPENGALVSYITSGGDCLAEYTDGSDCGWECYVNVIKDNGTTPFRRITGTMNNTSEIWPKGKYKLKARVECDEDQPRTFSVYITAFIPTAPPGGIIPVGGLRIKKIENKFINDNKVQSKNFRYEDADDSNKSSGVLTNYPKYEHDYTVNKIGTDAGCVVVENKLCRYKLRRSLSNYPLATTQGSYVGYKHVIEDQETNGETRYTFEAYPDYNSGVFPYAPEENYEWRRGVLKNRKDYRKVNGVPSIVKEVIHNYSSSGSKNIYGIKVGSNFLQIFEGCGQPTGNPSGDYLKWSFYSTSTEMHNLTRTIERDYDINDIAKYIETTTDYTYSPKHYQLAETKTTVTRNNVGITKEILTSKKYPFDYTFTSVPTENTSLAIKKLQDLNIARAPIEELTVRQDRSSTNVVTNARVVGGSLITYKSYGPYPDQIYRLSINSPVALSTFGSGSSIVNNVFTKNALFQPLVLFDSYDSDGNIKKQRKADDMYYSYIWGYNNRYPIAEIKNCSSELDVACTSFEPESTGNWSYGATSNSPDANPVPTGKKCYSLSTGAIQKTLLAAGNVYILSYWKKSTASVTITGGNIVGNEETFVGINGWVMVKRKFTGASSISISGTGYIDELRLYPESSEMTTYTYDPLIGIRSITDNNGVSIYSDFDKLGRLEFLKDQKLNIMKYYQYNYKIQ